MAELIAKTACQGMLPVMIGTLSVSEVTPGQITSIAPYKGQEKTVSGILKETLGVGFPAVGRRLSKDDVSVVWAGHDVAFLSGAEAPEGLAQIAALTDQTDGWAVMRLEGPQAEDVLARLMPIDLKQSNFKRGHVARTELKHMAVILSRIGANAFEIMVMRSFAKTAIHDLEEAMHMVTARETAGE